MQGVTFADTTRVFSRETHLEDMIISSLLSFLDSPFFRALQYRHVYFALLLDAASYTDDHPSNLLTLTIARNRSFNYHAAIIFMAFP